MSVPKWWPNLAGKIEPSAQQAHRLTFDWLNQHEDAFASLKTQVDTATSTAKSAAAATTGTAATAAVKAAATAAATAAVASGIASTFGGVNPQVGTSYTIQTGDYGSLTTLNNAGAVAVTLNQAVAPRWFGAFENLGAGTVTLTPDTTLGPAVINGAASLDLNTGDSAWVFYDGMNWWALTSILPASPSFDVVTVSELDVMHIVGVPEDTSVTVVAGAGAGTGATAAVTGSDLAGVVSVVGGTSATGGLLATVTFGLAYAGNVIVVVSATEGNAAGLSPAGFALGTGSGATFEVHCGASLGVGTTYEWNYIAIG